MDPRLRSVVRWLELVNIVLTFGCAVAAAVFWWLVLSGGLW